MPIKNIVFDVGNVLVRWDREFIVQEAFPELDPFTYATAIFRHPTWLDVNKGILSDAQAIEEYHQRLGLDRKRLQNMMEIAKTSLIPIEGSFRLLKQLHEANYPLYALTDNTHTFMKYLRKTYDFWELFSGVVVSADVGYIKPSVEIYEYLLTHYHLKPSSTVFIDDVSSNIMMAKTMGMAGIVFENTQQCILDLRQLNIDC